jgi:hypothetical protein
MSVVRNGSINADFHGCLSSLFAPRHCKPIIYVPTTTVANKRLPDLALDTCGQRNLADNQF